MFKKQLFRRHSVSIFALVAISIMVVSLFTPLFGGPVSLRLSSGTALAQDSILFSPAGNYTVGTSPRSVAVGDFNGDGKLDLATANYGNNSVSILTGAGVGTFHEAVNYAVGSGSGPVSVAVGDFNRDGNPDLAVADNGSNTVSILAGVGDGTFSAAVNYAVGSYPWSVAVGDFNRDGKLDLATANWGSNDVSVLMGAGDGTFQPWVSYPVGTAPRSVAVGDFNGDGKLDLAVANVNSSNLSILLGTGDGTFSAAVNYHFAAVNNAVGFPYSVAVGDFNGDGKPDLAVADNASKTVSILLGVGDGTFSAAAVSYAVGTRPYSVAVGDFNRDRKLDLAVANDASNTVSILLNASPTPNPYLFNYTIHARGSQNVYTNPPQWFHYTVTTQGQESWVSHGQFAGYFEFGEGMQGVTTTVYRWSPPSGFTLTGFTAAAIKDSSADASLDALYIDHANNQMVAVVSYEDPISVLSFGLIPGTAYYSGLYKVYGDLQESTPWNGSQTGVAVVTSSALTPVATVNLVPAIGPHGGSVSLTGYTITNEDNTNVTTAKWLYIPPGSTTGTILAHTILPEWVRGAWSATQTGSATVNPANTYIATSYLVAPNGDTSWFATSDNPNVIVWMSGNELHARAAVPANTTTAAANQTATYSTSDQNVTLSATVTPGGGVVNEGNVTFTVKNGNVTIGSPVTSEKMGLMWSSMTSGTTNTLQGVWGTSSSDVFAVGDGGTILHWDGSVWSAMSSGTTERLYAVWGNSDTDVFAVGVGVILHYNGSAWSSRGPSYLLDGVWGTSSSDVFAVGGDIILHYDGNTWNMRRWPGMILYSVWGRSSSDVYAVGVDDTINNSGHIMHYDGSAWGSSAPYTSRFFGVWGSSSDIFVVGSTILHYHGSGWSAMSSGTTNSLGSVWGTSSSDVFAVGNGGTILHYNGSVWSTMSSGTTNSLFGVWEGSDTDVFAVGDDGTILQYGPPSAFASTIFTLPGGTPVDTYTIEADFSDGALFNPSSDTSHTLTVNKADTTMAADNQGTYYNSIDDQSVSLSATVTSPAGPVNEGDVTFTVKEWGGNITIGGALAPVSNGNASASLTLPGGTPPNYYTIDATYVGSSNFNPSSDTSHTLMVREADTITRVYDQIATSYSSADQDILLSATVTASGMMGSPAGPVNESYVYFSVRNWCGDCPNIGETVKSETVSDGNASAMFTLPGGTPAGTYIICASYGGCANYASSASSRYLDNLTVSAAPTSLLAFDAWGIHDGTVNLWARLTSGPSVSDESIDFQLNGTGVGCATTGSDGWAELPVISLSGIPNGTYPGYITASFAGDDNYTGSSGSGNLTVGDNTPTGSNVQVKLGDIGNITFENVGAGGITAVPQPNPTVPNFTVIGGSCYAVTTTATYSGNITLSLNYDPGNMTMADQLNLRMLHLENGQWVDVTQSVDTVNHVVIGVVTSLSPFVLGTSSEEETLVTGITREVNGNILPGVSITLDGTSPVLSDQSGNYEIMATATGNYTITAHKGGFRDRTQTVNIAGFGPGYAVTCNFQGQSGLIPCGPDIWYALDCVNHWLYPPNPDIGLDIWTALDVINAWLYPVPTPYEVGALFDESEGNQALGLPEAETVQMLEKQINDAGGINGHPLDVIMYDTQSNAATAATLANMLIEQGVVAIIGPTGTGESQAVKTITPQANVALVSCASGSVIVEPAGNNTWVFNTPQLDYIAIERLYTYLQEQNITKIALLTDTAGFGAAGRNWLKNQTLLDEYGLTIVPNGDQTYGHSDVDMTPQLTIIGGTEAQAIVCWGTDPGAAIVAQNMQTLGMTIPLLCSHGIAFKEFIDEAGTAANGVIFPSGKLLIADELPDSDPQKALLEKYKADFEAEYGVGTANNFGGHAYDALMMVVDALENVGPDKAEIRDYIENYIVNWPGIGGVFNMSPLDHNGLPRDPKQAMILVRIVNGEWTWLQD